MVVVVVIPSHRYGANMGIFDGLLGSLVSAGTSLINGAENRQQQNSTNAANFAESEMFAKNQLSWKAEDATNAEKLTGINRLAMLGVSPGSGPASAVFTPDDSISKAGQDIGRAMQAYSDKTDKVAKLNEELLQAKINNVNASTAAQQLDNSRKARVFASPGSPPTMHDNKSEKPAYQKYSSWPYSLLSHDAANTQFGPTSFVTGAELLPGLLYNQAIGTYEHAAPYVARAINNIRNPDVTLSGSPPTVGDMVD